MLLESRPRVEDKEHIATYLDKSVDKLAAWRWKTVASVTLDLPRAKSAVQLTIPPANTAKLLQSLDCTQVNSLTSVVLDNSFWSRCDALASVAALLAMVGRACQDSEDAKGQQVECPWEGCRAKEVLATVVWVKEQANGIRAESQEAWSTRP